MIQIGKRDYGKDYADNIIDDLLQFNKVQSWSISSGTGTAALDSTVIFEGLKSLRIQNTLPVADITATNTAQSTNIVIGGDYNLSLYLLKDEVDEFIEVEVGIFKNAAPLTTETFTIGSETTEDDVNDKWVRFMSPLPYALIKGDEITFTFSIKGKAHTVLPTTTVFIDGIMLNINNGLSKVVPCYTKPTASDNNSIAINTVTKTSAYTAYNGDYILCDATSGDFTITLPSASSSENHRILLFRKDGSANTVTVSGSENINGSTTQTLTNQYDSMPLFCDGVEWYIE
jgi:hypothetical protein